MARMKDNTPIAKGDVLLARRERRRERGLDGAGGRPSQPLRDGERIGLATEERMAARRAKFEAAEPVALEILEEARAALAVRFRFLDAALWRMPLVPCFDIFGIASDGRSLLFDPVYVVDRFKLSFSEVVRDVVHCLFHCIFRHPFMLYSVLRQPWDVACDIAIEALILELVGKDFPSNMDRRAKESLKVLSAHAGGVVTAERLYWFFGNEGNKTDLKSLAPMFFHDSHGLWYGEDQEYARNPDGQPLEGPDASPADAARQPPPRQSLETEALDAVADGPVEVPLPQAQDALGDEMPSEGEDIAGEAQGEGERAEAEGPAHGREPAFDELSEEELAAQWGDIAERMQVELETHLTRCGEGAGNLVAALKAVNREVGDYAGFLARFAALHEALRINDDEFDYIYYTYGLNRYGNMPLIEPLEYKEDRRVHDFAIAIDTSESCSGEVVQAFMSKTYSILKASESFHDRVNIHIIQCDAQVQEDTKITSLEHLEDYMRDFQLKGFGGTDFRPVFDYVDLLIEKGEFTDLRGLVYFTDGEGVFPRRPPAYDTVFAFLDDGYSDPEVPSWALKVLIDKEGLWT